MKNIKIDMDLIKDEESFHQVFAEVMGYMEGYGKNMNAWIDCMTNIDYPQSGLTKVHVDQNEILVLELENMTSFSERCPELYEYLIQSAAFVNWRRIERGYSAVLALSYNK